MRKENILVLKIAGRMAVVVLVGLGFGTIVAQIGLTVAPVIFTTLAGTVIVSAVMLVAGLLSWRLLGKIGDTSSDLVTSVVILTTAVAVWANGLEFALRTISILFGTAISMAVIIGMVAKLVVGEMRRKLILNN